MHRSAPPASVEKAPSRPNPRPRTTDVAACQNDESCFLLAENGGQNCAKLVFERFGRNKKNTLLRAIPTVAFFCHSFWHLIWKYIWHIFSDILFWHFFFWLSICILFWHPIWHPSWHFFWHFLWHSMSFYVASFRIIYLASVLTFFPASLVALYLAFYLTFFLAYVSVISSDIFLAFYLVYLRRFFVVEVRQGQLQSRACSWGPAGNTLILGLLFGSGGDHCNHELAVEVRRWTLWSWVCCSGPAGTTAITSLQLRSGGEHSDPGFAVRVRRGPLRSRACSLQLRCALWCGFAVRVGRGPLRSRACIWGVHSDAGLLFVSGGDHCDHELAVEVRRRRRRRRAGQLT